MLETLFCFGLESDREESLHVPNALYSDDKTNPLNHPAFFNDGTKM